MNQNTPWMAGYYLGDGSAFLCPKGYLVIALYFKPEEKPILDEALRSYGYEPKYHKSRTVLFTRLPNLVKDELRDLGVIGAAASWTKAITTEMHSLPADQKAELIAGYWDADGCIKAYHQGGSLNYPWLEAETRSEELSIGVSSLLSDLGILHSVRRRPQRTLANGDNYRIHIRAAGVPVFRQLIRTRLK